MTQGPGQRRIALLLEYQGTRYAGSQFQTNAPTVQAELETAIQKTTGERIRAAFAGRTDAGVHALGQVAAFSTDSALPVDTIRDALNAWLPRDIAVLAAAEVEAPFDPRRHALKRTYRYLIQNRPARPALERDLCWHLSRALDVDSMSAAAPALVGEHDFAAFAGALEEPAAGTRRLVRTFDVRRDGTRIVIEVTANAFLPHQVRRMTGALVEVGLGKLSPQAYAGLLHGPPSSAGPAAPARGLYLLRVDYPVDPFSS